MCGIAGFFDAEAFPDGADRLRRMVGTLRHRGPDDEGFYLEAGVGLGMRRLSIIDVAGGRQPLYSEDRSSVLVFNGEIYNHVELRDDLKRRGHRFATGSDGEVILPLFQEKGVAALQELNGMYAFCLWDSKRRTGYLVRDRLGIKPLYYTWQNNGRRLYFASELKAILAAGVTAPVDREALLRYLSFMYIPGPRTPFQGIYKLPPATVLRFGQTNSAAPEPYWTLPRLDEDMSAEDAREHFLALMDSSVEWQMRSDVPVGVFLSGGLDSSLIATLFGQKKKGRLLSFNVQYQGATVDEAPAAAATAKIVGAEHRVVKVGLPDLRRDLAALIWHMDEPHADSALLASYAVSRLAVHEVKVALNGTGGDELFGGYERYLPNPALIQLWHRLPGPLQRLGEIFSSRETVQKLSQNRTPDETYLWRLLQLKPHHLEGFFPDTGYLPSEDKDLRAILAEAPPAVPQRWMHLDSLTYLVDDLLLLLDKTTMAASLEGRVPFLDHRLVEFAARIPGTAKIKGGRPKSLMRQWLEGVLPSELLQRPKQGFGPPLKTWMEQGFYDTALRVIDRRPSSRLSFYWGLHGEALAARFRALNFQQVYVLLVLEIWCRLFLDGASPDDMALELK